MKRKEISNEVLDAIGRTLLESGRLTPDDIDQITARRDLFAGVRSGIAAERTRSASGDRIAGGWSWGAALVPLAASMIVIGAVYLGTTSNGPVQTPYQVNLRPGDQLTPGQTIGSQISGNAAVRTHSSVRPSAPATKRPVIRERIDRDEAADFYALTYDNNEDADMRLIRAELPRSSLIALGLNVHLENGNDKVKTDLLVGTDGVPRAIRIVK